MLEERSYDAWGRPRHPGDWSYNNLPADILDRGFTGHEHLEMFGLINMNGRLYDPMIGRFLSPDPYVQNDLAGAQAFNRYIYCFNNPLKYIDPTGERANPSGGGELYNMEQQMQQFWDFNDPWFYWGVGGGDPSKRPRSYYHRETDLFHNFDAEGNRTITETPLYEPGTITLAETEITYSARQAKKEWFENSIRDRGGFTEHWLGGAFMDLVTLGPVGGAVGTLIKGVPVFVVRVAKGMPKPTPKFQIPTNPPQSPPTTLPAGQTVRVMKPTQQYPNGYWVLSKEYAPGRFQPINPATGKPGMRHETHIPLPKGYWK